MEFDESRIQSLVDRPAESLAVELKTWINPDEPESQAKIVKALLALRNHDGGYLVIGFDNKSLLPDPVPAEMDVPAAFHTDKIQSLVGRFSSEPFEIAVGYGKRDQQSFPVIIVPPGVRTPVVAKSDLFVGEEKKITTGDFYVRTLLANLTPSSAKANWKDWPAILEICFHNREADIGRFLRRHLAGASTATLKQLLGDLNDESTDPNLSVSKVKKLLDDGHQRFLAATEEKSIALPHTGSWEVALSINGPVPAHALTKDFLRLLSANNPEYTGWPVWFDSSSFENESARPYVLDKKWEAFVTMANGSSYRHIDFMQFAPQGNFYHWRAFYDDLSSTSRTPPPQTAFDFSCPIADCTEAIAVGLAFAKAMGCDAEQCSLDFAFRWTGLKGRELTSWLQPQRYISGGRNATQDQVEAVQTVPLDTPLSTIGGLLNTLLQPLYEVFDGFGVGPAVIEDIATQLLERRRF